MTITRLSPEQRWAHALLASSRPGVNVARFLSTAVASNATCWAGLFRRKLAAAEREVAGLVAASRESSLVVI